jgi:hypothetical protein
MFWRSNASISSAPRAQSVDEGFEWVSAAIGAGAAGGLVLLLGVGGATFRRRGAHADATQ